jgi:hypothetical protein
VKADTITARLGAIEQGLSAEQRNESIFLQNSNRVTLIAAGVFASLGLLAMIFTGWFLFRAMNRLATFATAFPSISTMGEGRTPALLPPDSHLINVQPMEQSSSRLLTVIERLEKRVNELEHSSQLSLPPERPQGQNTSNGSLEQAPGPAVKLRLENSAATSERNAHKEDLLERVTVILGKGQSLLSLDKPQEALACFEEAITLEPLNAETLVKKGTALERLKRLEEALECYNRAIALNPSLTLAYLYKGGVCNQLERFSEALECYELALRTPPRAEAG